MRVMSSSRSSTNKMTKDLFRVCEVRVSLAPRLIAAMNRGKGRGKKWGENPSKPQKNGVLESRGAAECWNNWKDGEMGVREDWSNGDGPVGPGQDMSYPRGAAVLAPIFRRVDAEWHSAYVRRCFSCPSFQGCG